MDFVYDMTWAEFQIRLFAYRRQDLYQWQKIREIMWTSYIAPHQDHKSMVKRKEKFLPLEGDRKSNSVISDSHRLKFIEEFKKYQEKIRVNT